MTQKEVLAIQDVRALRRLHWTDFNGRRITEKEISHLLRLCDGLWQYQYPVDPSRPHALLHSGAHSDGFANVLMMLQYPHICDLMARQLVDMVQVHPEHGQRFTGDTTYWVVGSDHAGAALSHDVGRWLNFAKHDFAEKGPNNTQLWQRFEVQPDEVVLQVEELITTTLTLQAVRAGIRATNPNAVFAPMILALVHRSEVYEFEGTPILFLVHYNIKNWKPSECPLCASGSEAIRPKTPRENWARLTGKT